jgi:hypothetical protein
MRSRPQSFEEHAARCLQRAAETRRADLRMLYLDLASQWRELAATVRWLKENQFTNRSEDQEDDVD